MKRTIRRTWFKILSAALITLMAGVFAFSFYGAYSCLINYNLYTQENLDSVKEQVLSNEYDKRLTSVAGTVFNSMYEANGETKYIEESATFENTKCYFTLSCDGKSVCGTYKNQKGLEKHSFEYREYTGTDNPLILTPMPGYEEYGVYYSEQETVLRSYTIDVYPTAELYEDVKAEIESTYYFIFYKTLFEYRYVFIAGMIASAIIALILLILLIAGAGHKNGAEVISLSGFDKIPLDLLAAVTVLIALIPAIGIYQIFRSYSASGSLLPGFTAGICAAVISLLSLIFIISFAARVKNGLWWRNNLIYKVPYFLIKQCYKAIKRSPVSLRIALIALAFLFAEFLICGFTATLQSFLLIAVLQLLTVIPAAVISAAWFRELREASEKIAAGDYDHKISTKDMRYGFKAFGDNLNGISNGMNTAVEQKLKSERLKTELITNVSHDIKTPLTSIINYADLISREDTDNEKIKEYSEVLKRQSDKLKRLISDLVEASKINSGNIETQLSPTDLNTMCEQLEGEYGERLQEKNLSLISKRSEKPVSVMADGRHLQRIFDNLFGNVIKYSLPGTRVYLELRIDDNHPTVSLKNVSAYELGIPAGELMERFVRGDRSRHSEGNGLGLSIAGELSKAMGAELKLSTDGDLFKAEVVFKGSNPTSSSLSVQ